MKKRYSEEQIIKILGEASNGKVADKELDIDALKALLEKYGEARWSGRRQVRV